MDSFEPRFLVYDITDICKISVRSLFSACNFCEIVDCGGIERGASLAASPHGERSFRVEARRGESDENPGQGNLDSLDEADGAGPQKFGAREETDEEDDAGRKRGGRDPHPERVAGTMTEKDDQDEAASDRHRAHSHGYA